MRIVHCCLSGPFTDGLYYQENMLSQLNHASGHDVLIIASRETYLNATEIGFTETGDSKTDGGIKVKRLAYKPLLNNYLGTKLRAYSGLYRTLEDFRPDRILFHGTTAYDISTVARYTKNNPKVKLYVDSHEDFHNSARTVLSRNLLHRLFYRPCLRHALPQIAKILYLTAESRQFLQDLYHIPDEKLEFFPLGGIPCEDDAYRLIRNKTRNQYDLDGQQIVLLHSGKLCREKKSLELLRAFCALPSDRLRLLIAGSLSDDIKDEFFSLANSDSRIRYLSWCKAEDLTQLMCASDLYMQPGTQSASMQNAACQRLALALYPYSSHQELWGERVFYVRDAQAIAELLRKLLENPQMIQEKRKQSYEKALACLDYRKLAERYLSD